MSSIRKIWEEKNSFENPYTVYYTVSGVSTSPIYEEPMVIEKRPPIFQAQPTVLKGIKKVRSNNLVLFYP